MILILGGAGYIGSHTNKYLNQHGYQTIVLDNLVYGHREFVKWGTFIYGDLSDKEQLRAIFSSYSIDAVVHFAAFAYVGESVVDPEKYYVNNLKNTLNLLEVMREAKVAKLIFSSTCATYGIPMEIPITENHAQNPINPYGQSKLMVEKILADYGAAYGMRYVALRYFNAAGADSDVEIGELHDPETHLIPLVIDAALGKRKQVQIFGTDYDTPDGTCVRDYIHVTDLAQAHLLALEYLNRGEGSDAFNLGNGKGFSVREVINAVEGVAGKNVQIVECARRAGDPARLVGCADKATHTLGWTPQFSDIRAIVSSAWKWHSARR